MIEVTIAPEEIDEARRRHSQDVRAICLSIEGCATMPIAVVSVLVGYEYTEIIRVDARDIAQHFITDKGIAQAVANACADEDEEA